MSSLCLWVLWKKPFQARGDNRADPLIWWQSSASLTILCMHWVQYCHMPKNGYIHRWKGPSCGSVQTKKCRVKCQGGGIPILMGLGWGGSQVPAPHFVNVPHPCCKAHGEGYHEPWCLYIIRHTREGPFTYSLRGGGIFHLWRLLGSRCNLPLFQEVHTSHI